MLTLLFDLEWLRFLFRSTILVLFLSLVDLLLEKLFILLLSFVEGE
jgi:hypothetical protein